MRFIHSLFPVILAVLFHLTGFSQDIESLPLWQSSLERASTGDWMLGQVPAKATIYKSADGKDIILFNGLVKRSFRLSPNVVCIDFKDPITNRQLLRAVKPEARLTINGRVHNIGGLYGQIQKAYLLPEWLNKFEARAEDFQFADLTVTDIAPSIAWKPLQSSTSVMQPKGKQVRFTYRAGVEVLKDLVVHVYYELYDGIPLISKWVVLENNGATLKIDRIVNEILAVVEEESAVVGNPELMKKQQGLYIETNYAFNNAMRYNLSDQTTHWKIDSTYTSQVNYDYNTPCVLEVYPDKAPGVELSKGEKLVSVKTFELILDSYDRERRGMAVRKMYRTIIPWAMQNPIFMHLVSKDDTQVRTAIDQCAATGYEALILSFGSNLVMEDSSAANIRRWKSLADYAHEKGIFIGGYSLFSSRKISDKDDVINPKTGKTGGAFFGNAPCFGSEWGLAYRNKIKYFFEKTGFNIWENDGPYPGDVCASTTHPGHRGVDDSQWRQMEIQKGLYRWLNEKGVYINAPDWYFLDGSHKTAVGYREVNFSLPREEQRILNRQNIFDGTWEKTPSMGWGFVPLTQYHGGGTAATLEPLDEHLRDYEQLMMQYYGAGVQACYRGPRLYDTDRTRQKVIDVITWYKKYRDILNSDVIHLRRADGRDWDGILHVNPALKTKGLMMVYNPLKEKITRTIPVPVYYTGLGNTVRFTEKSGKSKNISVNAQGKIELTFSIEAEDYNWFTLE